MITRFAVGALLFALIILAASGCSSGPAGVVERVLDCVLDAGCSPTDLSDSYKVTAVDEIVSLMFYAFRGYEIKHVSGDSVSVEMVFKSKAGTDLKETWLFAIEDGEIAYIYD